MDLRRSEAFGTVIDESRTLPLVWRGHGGYLAR